MGGDRDAGCMVYCGWIHVATLRHILSFAVRVLQEASFACAAFCKGRRAVKSFLEVRESNIVAINMYRSFGFVEDGRRADYYKDNGEDAILMSLASLSR